MTIPMADAGLTKSVPFTVDSRIEQLDGRGLMGGVASGIGWHLRRWSRSRNMDKTRAQRAGPQCQRRSADSNSQTRSRPGDPLAARPLTPVSVSCFALPCRHGRCRNYGKTRAEPYVEAGVSF